MRAAALWEKIRLTVLAGVAQQEKWFAEWMARVKSGVAEIAAAKSFQQFGREEKEKQ